MSASLARLRWRCGLNSGGGLVYRVVEESHHRQPLRLAEEAKRLGYVLLHALRAIDDDIGSIHLLCRRRDKDAVLCQLAAPCNCELRKFFTR